MIVSTWFLMCRPTPNAALGRERHDHGNRIQLLSAIRSEFCDWARMAFWLLLTFAQRRHVRRSRARRRSPRLSGTLGPLFRSLLEGWYPLRTASSQSHRLAAFPAMLMLVLVWRVTSKPAPSRAATTSARFVTSPFSPTPKPSVTWRCVSLAAGLPGYVRAFWLAVSGSCRSVFGVR